VTMGNHLSLTGGDLAYFLDVIGSCGLFAGASETRDINSRSEGEAVSCLLDEVVKEEGIDWSSMMYTLLQVLS
jgi:hypothetical protein